jgi:cell division protein FtsN
MRNKETGEFELLVGDKQLLSGFFIGVLLLAVVFAMGYELGQNSPRSNKPAETAAAPPSPAQPARPQPSTPVMTLPSNDEPPPPGSTPADTTQAATQPPEKPPEPTTQPAREPSAPSRPAAAAAVSASSMSTAEPSPGMYWQVTARASRSSAEAVDQTLKDQGFASLIRPGPNNLTVVWVGPYADKDSFARARKRLEDAGFSNLLKRP